MKKQRAAGAMLSYVSIFINMAIALGFTPYLIGHLGKSEYGLFNLIGSFAAYLVVLDMGMNDSVIRYLVKHHGKGFRAKGQNFLANTFLFYGVISLLVGLAGLWLYYSLDALFGQTLSVSELDALRVMTWIITLNAMLTVFANPVGAFIISRQHFVFVSGSNIVLRLVTTAVLVVALAFGYKAVAVVAITAVLNVGLIMAKTIYAFGFLGMRVRLYRFDISEIKKLLHYSAPIFVVVMTEVIFWKLDNILLGNMIGAAVVGVYAVGMMFHKYFMSFSTAISKVMMPKIVHDLDAGADADEMERILTAVSRIQAMVIMLVLTGVLLYGKAFVLLWLGEGYVDAYYVMLLTLVPYSLELMGNVRNIFLQVHHLYWYRAVVLFVIAVLNIFLTIYAIKQWGMIGAAMSTGAAVVIGYIAISYIVWHKLKINIFSYLKHLSKGILPAILLALGLGKLLSNEVIESWTVLTVHIVLYTLLYGLLVRYVAMNRHEKESAVAFKNAILKKIKKSKM